MFFSFVLGYELQGELEPRTLSASSLSGSLISSACVTTANPSVISLAASDQVILPQFVTAAHNNNVKASLAIGGWTGSIWFSSNVGSADNRTAFVKAVTGLVEKYQLDGIDFDWEYPGKQGIGCNVVNPNDTANFLSFLQELRQSLGSDVIISAATDIEPFSGPSGAPFTGISNFSQVLDYIVIMNYDIPSTPSSGVGPSSPLNDNCAPAIDQHGSAQSAITAWTQAGMPADQIVLGVPAYGHSYRVPQDVAFADQSNLSLAAYPEYDANDAPTGDVWSGDGGLDVCGVYEPSAGTYAFWSLIDDGFLDTNGSAKQGIAYRFDNCSQTPYVYNQTTEIMVAYDNPQSFTAKGNFIKANGLRGFSIWESAGDYNDLLVNAILNGTINGVSNTAVAPSQASGTTKSSSAFRTSSTWLLESLILSLGLVYIRGWAHI
ncbi:hypothetical protein H0H92_007929 [Tricholoma furcatifolium]|nr:hypothetical protein H0H92_007929 [Tricholoma furcatifolium]